ncbi:GNAT family N-acetyltransferase [Granulicella sibirica]|uniref:Acetyltransferase n=1 Tax=Granulicella sibirica TaxID=2479048 RepID=A0A4Q0T3K1_9BACT|nr:GNAT family N-acetyltransferase [Granulicella sibirica]RXH57060.1 acetyltransferase [Granulicella sibirica]
MPPAPPTGLILREATPSDVPQIHAFIRALADFEREPHAVLTTEADLLRDGFGPTPRFHCILAELDGDPAGFALYFHTYSTWTGAGIHLEDLFVLPAMRGKGIGKALITSVASAAHAAGFHRLQWNVLDWNTPAIDFYESLGAVPLTEWRIMRVAGESLPALAQLQP